MLTAEQEQIDTKNKAFWNELCGTQLAKELGVVDAGLESLAKFDNFYGKLPVFRLGKRSSCLDSYWARKFGLDLYIEARK